MAGFIVEFNGESRCPEAEFRAGLSDEDFWAHVFGDQHWPTEPDGGYDQPSPDDDIAMHMATPCPSCGASGACSYDDEGRALIHVNEVELT